MYRVPSSVLCSSKSIFSNRLARGHVKVGFTPSQGVLLETIHACPDEVGCAGPRPLDLRDRCLLKRPIDVAQHDRRRPAKPFQCSIMHAIEAGSVRLASDTPYTRTHTACIHQTSGTELRGTCGSGMDGSTRPPQQLVAGLKSGLAGEDWKSLPPRLHGDRGH